MIRLFDRAGTGVEMSLPKIVGATVMFVLVYALLVRFVFPHRPELAEGSVPGHWPSAAFVMTTVR